MIPSANATFDDFTIGEELEFGEAAFELDEMIAFAELWDPQLFHADSAAAAKSAFGGIGPAMRCMIRGTVVALEPSQSGKPRGRLDFRVDFENQTSELVGEMTLSLLLPRPADPSR